MEGEKCIFLCSYLRVNYNKNIFTAGRCYTLHDLACAYTRVGNKSTAQLKLLVFFGSNHQQKPIAKAHLEKNAVRNFLFFHNTPVRMVYKQ